MSVEWVINALSKFSKVEELVLHTWTGPRATEKLFLQLPEHRLTFGCANDFARSQHVLPSLVEVYVEQVLWQHSDTAGSEQGAATGKAFVMEKSTFASKEGLLAGLCQPDRFLCGHFLYI